MFESLKNKLKSWLGKGEEKERPAKEKGKKERIAKASKPTSKKEEKAPKKEKAEKLPSDKQLKEISKEIEEEVPSKFVTGQLQYLPDTKKIKEEITEKRLLIETPKEEEKSFFSKLFGKKEKPANKTQPQEQHPITSTTKLKSPQLEKLRAPEEKEEEKPKGFFSKLSSKFTTSTVTKEQVEEIFQDLEIILLENNVALKVVDKIKENLIKDLVNIEVKKGKIEETTIKSLFITPWWAGSAGPRLFRILPAVKSFWNMTKAGKLRSLPILPPKNQIFFAR